MTYALIKKGAVERYPYSFVHLRADNPQVSFPSEADDKWLAGAGVVRVEPTTPPVPSATKNVVEGTPVLREGVWRQVWTEVDASPSEIVARQKAAALDAEQSAAKLDAWIVAFLAMTPAQAENHVLNNAATLAQLRGIVSKLAYAVRVLVRREFNA